MMRYNLEVEVTDAAEATAVGMALERLGYKVTMARLEPSRIHPCLTHVSASVELQVSAQVYHEQTPCGTA